MSGPVTYLSGGSGRSARIALLSAWAICAAWFVAPSARAATEEAPAPPAGFTRQMQEAAELMRQGLDRALDSVETLLRSVPQYELPRMDDNGDIVIRRKRPLEQGGARPDKHDGAI